MNARTERFEFDVIGGQIPDTISSVFHTILFLRSTGRFHYKDEGSYSIAPLSVKDQACDFLDLTYTRVDSSELDRVLQQEAEKFSRTLRASDAPQCGEITLTFYQKKEKRWPFTQECIPWEIWNLSLRIITLPNEHERNSYRTSLGLTVADKIMYIAEIVSRDHFVPKNPNHSDLDNVFNTTFPTVQPYLFKIDHAVHTPQPNTMDTIKRFMKDTLTLR